MTRAKALRGASLSVEMLARAEAQGAARERRRIRAAIRALRRKWDARTYLRGQFDGSMRAVQALDEVLRAMRATRKPPRIRALAGKP